MHKPETLSLVPHALDTWQAQLWRALPDMVSALIVLLIFYVLARLLRRAAVRVYARLFPHNKTGKLVGSVVYGAMCFSGVVLALVFIGLPFVVRAVQPALEELDRELEDAAAEGDSELQ